MRFSRFALVLAAVALCRAAAGAAATPRVDLELAASAGLPLTGPQKWLEALKDLGFSNLRIRSGQASDEPAVREAGDERFPLYRVTGVLSARNRLQLPGGEFGLSDRAAIASWLARLRSEGVEDLTARRVAFGLTSKQLAAVHEALVAPVAPSTKGRRAGDVVRQIGQLLPLPLAADAAAQRALGGDDTVADELQGVSSGTALAAVLRPLGLVFAPEKPLGGPLQLRISDARQAQQSWPVGWPLEGSLLKVAPQLSTRLNVEIQDIALDEALAAIGQRLGVPVLADHNSLARRQVELHQTKVSLPPGRMHYKQILDLLLRQAQLKCEVRVDEAQQPLLWVTARGG